MPCWIGAGSALLAFEPAFGLLGGTFASKGRRAEERPAVREGVVAVAWRLLRVLADLESSSAGWGSWAMVPCGSVNGVRWLF